MIQQEQHLKLQRLERLLKNKDLVAFFAKKCSQITGPKLSDSGQQQDTALCG